MTPPGQTLREDTSAVFLDRQSRTQERVIIRKDNNMETTDTWVLPLEPWYLALRKQTKGHMIELGQGTSKLWDMAS